MFSKSIENRFDQPKISKKIDATKHRNHYFIFRPRPEENL